MAGALENIRVVEVGSYAPMRLATKFLSLMGAEVITIEKPSARRPGEFYLLDDDTHAHWTAYQTNKLSMTLDLKSDSGYEAFRRLIEKSDVFVEGHMPGAMARIRADEPTLREINPGLIYCSVSGFGQEGPYAHLYGHESNYQAMSGMASLTGMPGGPPMLSGFSAGDRYGGSAMATIGILAALVHRAATGEGQLVDAGCAPGLIGGSGRRFAEEYWTKGELSGRGLWNNWDGHPGYGIYETKDGRYISISVIEPWSWNRLCDALERPDLRDRAWDEDGNFNISLRATMAEVFLTRTRDEWWEFNSEHNVSVLPVLEVQEVLTDPHYVGMGLFPEVYHPRLGQNIKQVSLPFKLSKTPGEVNSMPMFGEHTDKVLGLIGYEQDEIERMRETKTID